MYTASKMNAYMVRKTEAEEGPRLTKFNSLFSICDDLVLDTELSLTFHLFDLNTMQSDRNKFAWITLKWHSVMKTTF